MRPIDILKAHNEIWGLDAPTFTWWAAGVLLASISTVLELTNAGRIPCAPGYANRRRNCFPPNQGMGVGSSASPEATR